MSHSKTALVTGGTRGIGYGIAELEELAAAGYDLVLGYQQNQERAQDARAHLQGTYKVRVFLVGGTTEEEATVDAYFSCIDENFGGKLNALVHNAGAYWGGRSPSKPDANGSWFQGWEAYEYYQGMYPKCFIRLVEKAVTRMEDERGYIVAVSSPGCNNSSSPYLSYVSPGISKASVEYLVRHYAKQLAPRRITCNVIIPGFTKTEAWGPVVEDMGADQVEGMVNSLGMKRWGSPREVGGVVAFLCSEKAAFVTGIALPIDGGLHLK
ncbi:3-oxoacyl-[acyl-carrier-protein] reductase FabG-like [Branchiostoma lanceolatum]|uniref:3-oxoacyl-[acyl-carrier-protein] reductase FabG-like n=1 Tax=Branchiostoma lanceolatum TaxID=7740 RepID=UPI003455C2AF